MRQTILGGLWLAAATAALAQPVLRPDSITNAASNLPVLAPNAALAQGGMFIVKGQRLGPRGIIIANSFPLQINMGGTQIRLTVGGTTMAAYMVYVVGDNNLRDDQGQYDQLAGIVPSNMPTGGGTLTVITNGQTSASIQINIVQSAFGIFTINQQGYGPGVFTDPNYAVKTMLNSAHAGDQLFIWGTGLGPITGNDGAAPPVGNLNFPAEVYVGGIKATTSYLGRSGCCAAIDQLLFTVPQGVEGCHVPVYVKIGARVSNFASLPITGAGAVCSDSTGLTSSELQKATPAGNMTVAGLSLGRIAAKVSAPGVGTLQGNVDFGDGTFRQYSFGSGILASTQGALAGFQGVPSVACTVQTLRPDSQDFFDNLFPGGGDAFRGLDAGPALNIRSATAARQLPRENPNNSGSFEYHALDEQFLGGGIPGATPVSPEFLLPGDYTVDNGAGTTGVGPFSARVTVPPTLVTWTGADAIGNINRNQDLVLNIGAAPAGTLSLVIGSSTRQGVSAQFICSAANHPGGNFTIPAAVLSALPASGLATDPAIPIGFLGVATTLASPTRFTTRGVDAGHLTWQAIQVRNVNYQ